jgi:hypothetical protein
MIKQFRHLKTRHIYQMVRDDVINCTNEHSNQIMVLYRREDYPELIFVREKEEFLRKFEEVQ